MILSVPRVPPVPPVSPPALDADGIQRALRRVADEIAERHAPRCGPADLALVGIQTRGVEVARRLADHLAAAEGARPAFGTLDISLHRDDFRRRPPARTLRPTDLPFSLESRTVVLVDDVFFTGRTIRAAMDALADFGRPARLELAVLVDRGGRELPIRPDYVGRELPVPPPGRVLVRFAATDDSPDGVWVEPA